jgi:hypothetical protein
MAHDFFAEILGQGLSLEIAVDVLQRFSASCLGAARNRP